MDSRIPPDFSLRDYMFDLPDERIAQWPARNRTDSRLMVLDRNKNALEVTTFSDILSHLPENCLLVANNSRVVPARLTGRRQGGGGLEFLLLTPLPLLEANRENATPLFPGWYRAEAEALLRPSKKVRVGEVISFGDSLSMQVLEKGDFGKARVELAWNGDILSLFETAGSLPLPPYIKRPASPPGETPATPSSRPVPPTRFHDRERYQTVYARKDKSGSSAAPTAGLHFTPSLCRALTESGREWAELTLYVGYGTFSPVRCEDIRQHPMHAEYVEMSDECAKALRKAKEDGRPVIAVGTTSCRALEGICAMQTSSDIPDTFSGWVNHFLYPGRQFNIIDGLITNFHLPGSSLLMLVSALAGRERILNAYQEAIRQEFRFFSYGDAMLIL